MVNVTAVDSGKNREHNQKHFCVCIKTFKEIYHKNLISSVFHTSIHWHSDKLIYEHMKGVRTKSTHSPIVGGHRVVQVGRKTIKFTVKILIAEF